MKLRHFLACFALMGLMVSCGGDGDASGSDSKADGDASGSDSKADLACTVLESDLMSTCIEFSGTGVPSVCPDGGTKVDACTGYKFTCSNSKDGVAGVAYYKFMDGVIGDASAASGEKSCTDGKGTWAPL